jgi:hypothetical protein
MPSQDNENAMDGLLRRSLARDSTTRGDCPDAELLAAYFDQSLGADEAAGYELHFSTCPRCRERLAAMARANAGQQLHPADLALEPALAGARPVPAIALGAARTPAQGKSSASGAHPETKLPERRSSGTRWLDLRWLIPVAAVLILGTVSLIHFGSQTKNLGVNNEVAISKPSAPPQDQVADETDKKLESNEPQKMLPPEAKQASPPVAKTKSAPKSAPTYSEPPAHPSAPPAASASSGGSGGERGGGGGATSYRTRPGSVVYGHAGVMRPSMPGAARTTTGSHFSSGARGNANSASAQRVESNSAERAAPDENSAASQNSAADQNTASQDQSAAVESADAAPPAPAPELNAALQKVPVSSDAAEPVKSPAPAPPAAAQEKSKSTETATRSRSFNGLTAKSVGNFGVAKHSSAILVHTADPNVIYRIARTGGLVELSNDGGNTWQSRLLDPPADINAHSEVAPRICWLVGSSGAVFVTEDGKAWRKLPPPAPANLVEVVAKDAYRATVTSEDGQKWTTDDAGDIWYPAK